MKTIPRWRTLATVTTITLLAACGSSAKTGGSASSAATTAASSGSTAAAAAATTAAASSGKPVTINWWHIQNTEPAQGAWQSMADAYMKAHPNVTIKVTVMENEAFKAVIKTNIQSGTVPDLFQSWGGGGLREQVKAGVVQDITAKVADVVGNYNPGAVGLYTVDNKTYALPFNLGMVGFWYNKDLFQKAGITDTPTTWTALLEDIKKLKAAGITPVAVGAGDKWPAHFWYSYLMIRIGGADVMNGIAKDLNFAVPTVLEAGQKVQDLVKLEPFQPGFLGAQFDAPDGETGTMANGKAAMDLMGQWGPGAFAAQLGLKPGEKLPWNIGWFPFPTVEGGKGQPTDAFGGGDGFAVGKNAPPEAIDFLKFLTDVDNQKTWGKNNSGLPVVKGSDVSITDPNMQLVLGGLGKATFVQLYLDQFFTPAVGGAVNDATQTLFAGSATPDAAAKAITTAAKG